MFDYGKTESRAARASAARFVRAVKSGEYLIEFFLWNADARVLDGNVSVIFQPFQ